MTYKEEEGNLFDLPEKFVLAHCIDQHAVMGAGIAPQFCKQFGGMREYLNALTPLPLGSAVPYGSRVYNLITKPSVWMNAEKNQFPNITTIRSSLLCVKAYMQLYDQKHLGLPMIGCGLDKLDWDRVSATIKNTFWDTQVNIVVRVLPDQT